MKHSPATRVGRALALACLAAACRPRASTRKTEEVESRTLSPVCLVRLWRVATGSAMPQPPAVRSHRVYAATAAGTVLCLRVEDGARVWSVDLSSTNGTGHPESIEAPVAVASSIVVVATTQGKVYGLDTETGERRWTYIAGDRIQGAPALFVHPDSGSCCAAILTQPEGILHAITVSTGTRVWIAAPTTRADGSPAADSDHIVFGNCNAALHILSARDGRALRRIDLGPDSQVAGGVALSEGQIFSGTRSGLIVCADVRSGGILWTNRDVRAEVFTTPAVCADRVVAAASDGTILCLRRQSGEQLWATPLPDGVQSPVILGSHVVACAGDTLMILSLDTGAHQISRSVGGGLRTAAVAENRILVVAAEDGSITAWRLHAGTSMP